VPCDCDRRHREAERPAHRARNLWYDNADQIAQFLSAANPNFKLNAVQAMMKMHLGSTLAEAVALLGSDWSGSIVNYDDVVKDVLAMADALAGGIAAQFPDLVPPSGLSSKAEDQHVAMRELWEEHIGYHRAFLVSDVASLPDLNAVQARLLQNQADIGDAIKPVYGGAAGDALTNLLRGHIQYAVEAITAAQTRDSAALAAAEAKLYANGNDIAAFLAKANPNLPQSDLETMMKEHIDQVLAEATARLGAQWTVEYKDYDLAEAHILAMADGLSDAIVKQFPDVFGTSGGAPAPSSPAGGPMY